MRLEILTFEKYRDLETRIRSHWRSLEMSPFDSAHATSYWCSIVNMALSSVVSEIFNVENLLTLKSGSEITQAHWKLYRSIDLVCFPISSNFVPKTHHFWDIPLYSDCESRVRGQSRSSKPRLIDPPHMISY